MPNMDGGCLCGDVRYSATGEPKVISTCHCTDCQKLTGSAFRVVVPAPIGSFVLHGEPKRYVKVAEECARGQLLQFK